MSDPFDRPLFGGGDPYGWERGEDDAAQRRNAKAAGTFEQQFPNEVQWAPSVHQETLARLREQANEGDG